jgi:hypothetical protein
MRTMLSQASAIVDFYGHLDPIFQLPKGIEQMNPFKTEPAWNLTRKFYEKFYSDREPRVFIFGINPGRFGGGITGIPFTDPIRLEADCGLANDLRKLPELSSEFVYRVIDAYGGVKPFYGHFFVTALCPLGFTRKGKNLNYYDDMELMEAAEPFMVSCLRKQKEQIAGASVALCLGEGKNYTHFCRLNKEHRFFERIIPLPHPRFIMQYKRKRLPEFIQLYVQILSNVFPTKRDIPTNFPD